MQTSLSDCLDSTQVPLKGNNCLIITTICFCGEPVLNQCIYCRFHSCYRCHAVKSKGGPYCNACLVDPQTLDECWSVCESNHLKCRNVIQPGDTYCSQHACPSCVGCNPSGIEFCGNCLMNRLHTED